MRFWSRLFGRKQSREAFYENDNMGTRQDSLSLANSHWRHEMPVKNLSPMCFILSRARVMRVMQYWTWIAYISLKIQENLSAPKH